MLPIRPEASALDRPAAAPIKPPEPSLRGQLAGLLRHRFGIVFSILATAAIGVAFTMYSRPVFEATSVVRFEVEQVDLPQLVQLVASDNLIRTEIEVLGGRSVGQALVDSLGLRARLVTPRQGRKADLFTVLEVPAAADTGTIVFTHQDGAGFAVTRKGSDSVLTLVQVGDVVTVAGLRLSVAPAATEESAFELRIDDPEDALLRVRDNVTVGRPARDADLISIEARSAEPAEAAAMANFLANNLIARRQEVRRARTGVAAAFLREQADSLGRQLRAAEDSLKAYQQREHVVDAPEQARTQVTRLAGLQTDLSVIRSDRDAFAALVEQLRRDSAGKPLAGPALSRRLMAFPALLQNQSASVLLGSLSVVENERAALLVRRLPTDPDVQVLTSRIQEIEVQLQGIAESYLQSLTNQVTTREAETSRFGTELDALPEKELQTARREREAKILNDLWVLVQTRLKEAEITGSAGDPSVRLVDAAAPPAAPIRPRPIVNLAVSLLLGALIGITVALARELADRSVRSRADAHAAAGLPVLGAFPKVRQGRVAALPRGRQEPDEPLQLLHIGSNPERRPADPKLHRRSTGIGTRLITHPGASGAYREAFNQLFANLALTHREEPLKTVVFTSALPGEGKTLSAVNFALTGASRGLRVLLIDADLRCGLIGTVLDCNGAPGFSELLAGTVPAERVLRDVPVGDQTSLTVIPAGAVPKVPGRVLTVGRVSEVLRQLAPQFDIVVIDSPPVNLLADAALLGSAADGVLVVVRAGRTPSEALRYAMDQLESTQAPVLGLLLNDIDLQRNETDDDSYRYLVEAERYHATVA